MSVKRSKTVAAFVPRIGRFISVSVVIAVISIQLAIPSAGDIPTHASGESLASSGGHFEARGRNPWQRDSYADAAATIVAANAGTHAGGETSFSSGGGGSAGGGSDGGYSGGGGGSVGGAGMYGAASSVQSYGAPAPQSSSYGVPAAAAAEPIRYYYQVMPNNDNMMMSGSGWGMMEDEDEGKNNLIFSIQVQSSSSILVCRF